MSILESVTGIFLFAHAMIINTELPNWLSTQVDKSSIVLPAIASILKKDKKIDNRTGQLAHWYTLE